MDYLRDPAAIYARSFDIIRQEADLVRLTTGEQAIAIRMIHACGMTDLAQDLVFAPGFVQAAHAALISGRPIFVDVEMVRHGIITRKLPANNQIICTLNYEPVRDLAAAKGITRSAAAVEFWGQRLAGAIVVIGNAPTALFHLLELLQDGVSAPAAIVACPVGFVGAVESKEAVIERAGTIPFVTVRGRRGGSAMAAAVINALAGDLA